MIDKRLMKDFLDKTAQQKPEKATAKKVKYGTPREHPLLFDGAKPLDPEPEAKPEAAPKYGVATEKTPAKTAEKPASSEPARPAAVENDSVILQADKELTETVRMLCAAVSDEIRSALAQAAPKTAAPSGSDADIKKLTKRLAAIEEKLGDITDTLGNISITLMQLKKAEESRK